MARSERCAICHEIIFGSFHKCKSVWYVAPKEFFDFGFPTDHTKVFANNEHEAGSLGLEMRDKDRAAEPSIGETEVIVYEESTGAFIEVIVTVEVVVEYSSYRAKQLTLEDMQEEQKRLQGILDKQPGSYTAKQKLEFVNSFIENYKGEIKDE